MHIRKKCEEGVDNYYELDNLKSCLNRVQKQKVPLLNMLIIFYSIVGICQFRIKLS